MELLKYGIPILNLLPKFILTYIIIFLSILLIIVWKKYMTLKDAYKKLNGIKKVKVKPKDKPSIELEVPLFSFIEYGTVILPLTITNRALTKITITSIYLKADKTVLKTPITMQKSLYFQNLMYAEAKKQNITEDGPELMEVSKKFRETFKKLVAFNDLLYTPITIQKGDYVSGHLILNAFNYSEKQFIDDVTMAKGKVKLIVYIGESKKGFLYKRHFIPADE